MINQTNKNTIIVSPIWTTIKIISFLKKKSKLNVQKNF